MIRPNGSPFYGTRVPDLHGLRYRRYMDFGPHRMLTDEQRFDPARLSPDSERKGWSPPGVTKAAVPGLDFLTKLSPEDKAALIAFLRSL